MKKVKTIPNEPGLLVSVSFMRSVLFRFGPNAGQSKSYPMNYGGCSAREISAELSEAEASAYPVVWRFFRGMKSGGDDPKAEPPWDERRIEVPATEHDATASLQIEMFAEGTKFK